MLLALERSRFNYLYKLNQITVDINSIIDLSIEEAELKLGNDFNGLIDDLDRVLPVFEEDHEIILLEVEKSKLNIQGKITIAFDAVYSIYPLTETGKKLLFGKLNEKFRINPPVFEKAIKKVKEKRTIQSRQNAVKSLLSHFSLLDIISEENNKKVSESVSKLLNGRIDTGIEKNYLDCLLAYNVTPSYMPDGNVEFLCKVGAIAMKLLGKPENALTNGPFYKSCIAYKQKINSNSFANSFTNFLSINDGALRGSHEKIVEIISKDFSNIDIFKVSYFFLAFKSYLNKNEIDFLSIKNEIEELGKVDKTAAAWVLTLLGYVFSFDQLYESLHILNSAPLFKTSLKLDKKENKEPGYIYVEEKQDFKEIDSRDNQPEMAQQAHIVVTSEVKQELSEPVVFYENTSTNESITKVNVAASNDTSKDEEFELNKEVKGEISETAIGEKSVSAFRKWVFENIAKTKKIHWNQFVEAYLVEKYDFITLEIIENMIGNIPGLKDKLLKTKKDKDAIKDFFSTKS